ncbi:hypothetical protein CONPUDRAFT_145439 [Coniophora puteana RWD-64-598 SS2]|uniref:Cryptic loci regulator 2 N-terminal domain-containing protein n=1 Tax=Coniophora puteana (strain RWD-64-598) TaxID=741705 RepID=A0A5M3MKC0_CONPW|nr:uncharacterized protein CONPUDRAFT_145439 [Coniophora puteana RWD-64-598 SS2]EIW79400.1 hypothetical protein CONPUDRAFT_145439 [Coniophora puteana RWD-64-598 SS2]
MRENSVITKNQKRNESKKKADEKERADIWSVFWRVWVCEDDGQGTLEMQRTRFRVCELSRASMSHRALGGQHTLPPNPHYIDFPRSDGDDQLLPTNTARLIDSEGHVNFMRPVDPTESSSVKWRRDIAVAIATRLGMPDGPAYILRNWPAGYNFYDHNKGPASAPRHDPYLIGSQNVKRFRSVPEFIPHAVWLFQDPTLNRANCACKYCNKRPQREITEQLGLLPKRGSPATDSRGPSASAPHRMRAARGGASASAGPSRGGGGGGGAAREVRRLVKPYASVRRAARPVKLAPPGPTQTMSRERSNDLRALYAHVLRGSADGSAEGQGEGEGEAEDDQYDPLAPGRRWFREGEVLWCALDPVILGPNGEADAIMFWPGIVEEVKIKATPVRVDAKMEDGAANANGTSREEGGEKNGAEAPKEPGTTKIEDGEEVPWKVSQGFQYKMRLLATQQCYYGTPSLLIPYSAYTVPHELFAAIDSLPPHLLRPSTFASRSGSSFEVYPPPEAVERMDPQERFEQAAGPYALALQIAAGIATFWTPTDEWEYKFTITPPSVVPPTSAPVPAPGPGAAPPLASAAAGSGPDGGHMELHAAMMAAYNHNANLMPSSSSAAPDTAASPAPPPLVQTVTQTRYQGLWWGAERIWTDELVRLKLARAQIAPEGNASVYAPAGPSASAVRANAADGYERPDDVGMGAMARGVFMRLEGLFIVDAAREEVVWDEERGEEVVRVAQETQRECRACGMLYELVDEDWEEPVGEGAVVVGDGEAGPSGADAGPTVPASAAPNGETTAMTTTRKRKRAEANDHLSHPVLSTPLPLPPAPLGFKFRAILPPGHEATVSLNLLSGRYYPRILHHPLISKEVEKSLYRANAREVEVAAGANGVVAAPDSDEREAMGIYAENKSLLSLEGHAPGYNVAMDPTRFKANRIAQAREAEAEAREQLEAHWVGRLEEREEQERGMAGEMQMSSPVRVGGGVGGDGSPGRESAVGGMVPYGPVGDGQMLSPRAHALTQAQIQTRSPVTAVDGMVVDA